MFTIFKKILPISVLLISMAAINSCAAPEGAPSYPDKVGKSGTGWETSSD